MMVDTSGLRHGQWIFRDASCKCSICREDPMIFVETNGFDSALMDSEYPMRFCPNCGADMRDDENGQTDSVSV